MYVKVKKVMEVKPNGDVYLGDDWATRLPDATVKPGDRIYISRMDIVPQDISAGYKMRELAFKRVDYGFEISHVTTNGIVIKELPSDVEKGVMALPCFLQDGDTYEYNPDVDTYETGKELSDKLEYARKIIASIPPALRGSLPEDDVEAALFWAVNMFNL